MPHVGAAAFRNPPYGDREYGRRNRKVNEEYPSPGGVLNQPATENRPHGTGNRRKTGPSADRRATTLLIERRTNNGKTAGHKKCSSDSLNAPRDDQLMNILREATTCGSHGENRHA